MNDSTNNLNENADASPELSDQELDQVLAGVSWPELTESDLDCQEQHLQSLFKNAARPRSVPWVIGGPAILGTAAAAVLVGFVLIWQFEIFIPATPVTSMPDGEDSSNIVISSAATTAATTAQTLSPLELMVQTKALKSVNRDKHTKISDDTSSTPQPAHWFVRRSPRFQANFFSGAQRASQLLDQALDFAGLQNDFAIRLKLQRWVAVRNRIESQIVQELTANPYTIVSETDAWRLKLLCRAGSKKSFRSIMRLAAVEKFKADTFRDEFLTSVLRHADSMHLVQLATPLQHPDRRDRVIAELFRRSDRDSLHGVFQLSHAWSSLRSVQRGARSLPDLPAATIENLLVVLSKSQRKSHRMIAAAALAQSANPEISRRLIQMTRQPEHSRTAILALAGRTDLESTRFVRRIENDLQYATVVQSARRVWQRMPP